MWTILVSAATRIRALDLKKALPFLVLVVGVVFLVSYCSTRDQLRSTQSDLADAQGSVKDLLDDIRVGDEINSIRSEDQNRVSDERKQLEDATDGLPVSDISPRRRARLECVSRQREARERGLPVPPC